MAVLVKIEAWDPVAGAPVTLCAASHDEPDVCHSAGGPWWPAIAKLPVLKYDLFDGAFAGQITAPSSSLTLQIEPWPNFGRYQFADAPLELSTGTPGNWTVRFTGRVSAQPKVSAGSAEVEFAVDDKWLDGVLLNAYAGTTGAEGPAEIKGQAKPWALGAPRYVPGTLVDSINSIFQISDGPVHLVEAALERLARFSGASAIFSNYAALEDAELAAGTWAIAPSLGFVKFGAPPENPVSFLVQGDEPSAGVWPRKPGELIGRVAARAGGTGKIDAGALAALDAARPYNLSLYFDQQTSARPVVQSIAASVNAVAGVSWLGKLFVLPVAIGAPLLTLAADGTALPPVRSVEQIEAGTPFKRLAIAAERTWLVHPLSDVAFTAPLIEVGAYSATEEYREGNIVSLPDGSRWLFIATAPATGVAPGTDATKWTRLQEPVTVITPGTIIGGTYNPSTGGTDGGVPAEDVAQLPGRVETVEGKVTVIENDVATVLGDIAELFDVFGDTESASAAAAIAQQARDQAQVARTGAEGARDTAIAKAQEAGVKADAAAASATVAGARATDAGNSADAAATSAEAAHTDATNSGTSAAAAQASSVTATAVARGLLPSDFLSDGKFWFWGYEGDPATRTPLAAGANVSFPAVAGIGKVAQVKPTPNGNGVPYFDIGQQGVIKLVPGRRYRISVDYRATVLGDNPVIDAWAIYLNANFAYLNSPSTARAVPAINTRETVVIEVAGSTAIAAGAVYLRGMARMYGSGTYQLIAVVVEDITESAASASSATAAQNSSASAAASATDAGQKAGVATDQAGIATTKAAQASASQQAAATSETNAAGSMAAAASSQQLAASSSSAAKRSAMATLPSDFTLDGRFWFQGYTGDPATAPELAASANISFPVVSGVGKVLQVTGATIDIGQTPITVLTAGRRLRITIRWRATALGTAGARIDSWAIALDSAYNYIPAGSTSISFPATAANAWREDSFDYLTDTGLANGCWATRVLVRPIGGATGASFQIASIRLEDITDSFAATSQATVAQQQAVIATNGAAAAQTSAIVAANVGTAALTPNPTFSNFSDGAVGGRPDSWMAESTGYGSAQRVAGENGVGYAYRLPGAANTTAYVASDTLSKSITTGSWYVIEGDVKVGAGSLQGAGILFRIWNASNQVVQDIPFNFAAQLGSGGEIGRTYRFRRLVQVTGAGADRCRLYLLSHYTGFSSIPDANDLTWYRCAVRAATDAEIEARQATGNIAALSASVTTNTGAIANINGAAAFLETIVAAGDGNPAIMRMLAGKDGSGIWLMADRLVVGNPLNGQWVEVARFENGVAKLNNALIRNLLVIPNATANLGFPVELAPRIFLASDGQAVTYPASIGAAAARIEADTSGIAVPAGSSLDVRAINSTANGFTARAKIIGSPSYANQTATGGTNVGGSPAWQMDKPTAADAYNGLYQFSAPGTLTRTSYYKDGATWVGAYSGVMSCYVNTGSGFVFAGSVDGGGEYYYPSVPPATISTTFNGSIQFNGAIGQHGGKEFGVGGPVTGFSSVSYTTLSSATETAITQNIPFKVYPAR